MAPGCSPAAVIVRRFNAQLKETYESNLERRGNCAKR